MSLSGPYWNLLLSTINITSQQRRGGGGAGGETLSLVNNIGINLLIIKIKVKIYGSGVIVEAESAKE